MFFQKFIGLNTRCNRGVCSMCYVRFMLFPSKATTELYIQCTERCVVSVRNTGDEYSRKPCIGIYYGRGV